MTETLITADLIRKAVGCGAQEQQQEIADLAADLETVIRHRLPCLDELSEADRLVAQAKARMILRDQRDYVLNQNTTRVSRSRGPFSETIDLDVQDRVRKWTDLVQGLVIALSPLCPNEPRLLVNGARTVSSNAWW